jgi:SAM-dependent methyltransferase
MAAQLLMAFPGLRMVVTDYDPGMTARSASARVPGPPVPLTFRFADGRFSFVLSAAMLHRVVAWEKAPAEAFWVLRPGGRLTGYDLLDATPVRLQHFGAGHDTRMLRAGQQEAEFAASCRRRPQKVQRSAGGLAVRFAVGEAA